MKATFLRAVNEGMFFVQPAVLGCIVFGTYHFLGKRTNACEGLETHVIIQAGCLHFFVTCRTLY